MMRFYNNLLVWALLPMVCSVSACVGPPDTACERIRFSWPNFAIDPSLDTSQEDGIQIAFAVSSDLLPDQDVDLLIAEGDEDRVMVSSSTSGANGDIRFSNVTVPLGPIVFFLESEDECGVHRSGKRTFVWDGLGIPQCTLTLALGPAEDPQRAIPVLKPEHDIDETLAGFQTRVIVEAGRSDMEIRLFVVDQETGETQNFTPEVDQSGSATQVVTLGQGEQAVRAVCIWEPQNLRPSTPTWQYYVE